MFKGELLVTIRMVSYSDGGKMADRGSLHLTPFLRPHTNPPLSCFPAPSPLPPSSVASVAAQHDTSMVWVTAPTPSVLSELVQARERFPSMEPALVREAVLERARRVILAEGTGREVVKSRGIIQHYVL